MFSTLVWIFICTVLVESKTRLRDIVPVCNLNDVNVDDCLLTSSQQILPSIGKGVKDWNLAGQDPAFVQSIVLGHNNGPINMKWEFVNTTLTGWSKLNFTGARVEKKKNTYNLYFNFTNNGFGMKGRYQLTGKILLFPLKNEGYQEIFLGQSKIQLHFEARPEKRKGEEYLKIKKFYFDLGAPQGGVKVTLKGSKEKPTQIDRIMSKFLHENGQVLTEELRPTMGVVAGQIVRGYLQKFFDRVSVKELFKQ